MAAMFNKFHQIEDLLAIVGSWERFHLIVGLSYSQAFPPSLILKNRYFCQQGECEKLWEFYLTKLFQGITSVHNVFQWRILGNMFLWTTIYMWRTTRPVSQNCSMAGNMQEFSTSAFFFLSWSEKICSITYHIQPISPHFDFGPNFLAD